MEGKHSVRWWRKKSCTLISPICLNVCTSRQDKSGHLTGIMLIWKGVRNQGNQLETNRTPDTFSRKQAQTRKKPAKKKRKKGKRQYFYIEIR